MRQVARCWPRVLLGALMTLSPLTLGGPAMGQGGPAARGMHGATPFEQQLAMLDAFGLDKRPLQQAPRGVDAVVWAASIPADNALTPERVALGRRLFFEPRLSADGTVACATCHDVTKGFTDHRPVSEGIKDQLGRRNAPTALNAAMLTSQFLDGRSPTLENQARLPIINPIEMGMPDEASAVKALAGDAEYQRLFQRAYGRAVNFDDIARAIAAFERTLMLLESPFDRYLAGEKNAISAEAEKGWVLYNGKARCQTCHPFNLSNPLGSDGRFHNVGVSARHQKFEELATKALELLEKDASIHALDRLALETDMSELGRFMVTRNPTDIGGFRTLQIRNIGVTPPYMHDGSMQTLWDVMDHYNKGGEPNPYLDGGMEPLALSEEEINQVVAFLFTLTDARYAEENQRQMERQQEIARKKRPFRDEAMAFGRRLAFEPVKKEPRP